MAARFAWWAALCSVCELRGRQFPWHSLRGRRLRGPPGRCRRHLSGASPSFPTAPCSPLRRLRQLTPRRRPAHLLTAPKPPCRPSGRSGGRPGTPDRALPPVLRRLVLKDLPGHLPFSGLLVLLLLLPHSEVCCPLRARTSPSRPSRPSGASSFRWALSRAPPPFRGRGSHHIARRASREAHRLRRQSPTSFSGPCRWPSSGLACTDLRERAARMGARARPAEWPRPWTAKVARRCNGAPPFCGERR